MRMRIIALSTLQAFFNQSQYADSKQPFLAWHGHALKATWKSPAEVKADFGTASILKDGRVVFNIGGNKYRLVTFINYDYEVVYVKFVGTHKQYDAIDAQKVEVSDGN